MLVKCPKCHSMVDSDKPLCMSVVDCNEARWKREKAGNPYVGNKEGYMWGLIIDEFANFVTHEITKGANMDPVPVQLTQQLHRALEVVDDLVEQGCNLSQLEELSERLRAGLELVDRLDASRS